MVTLSPAIRPVPILPYLLSVEWLYCHLLFVEWLLQCLLFVECIYCRSSNVHFVTCHSSNACIVSAIRWTVISSKPLVVQLQVWLANSRKSQFCNRTLWLSTNLILCLRCPRYWKCWTTLCSCKECRSIIYESTKPLGASQIERCSAPAD